MTAPRRHLIAGLVPLIAVVTGSCAVSSLAPISFPADYSPEEGTAGINAAPACAHIRSLEVSDERPDTPVAGQRSVQDKPERHDIFMEGNIESWLRSGVRRALDLAVIRDNPSSGLVLSVTLTSLVIEEVAYVNSEYEGRVVLDLALRASGAATDAWTNRAEGTAQNYGRPGNIVNYQETVNHALDRAAAEIVTSSDLIEQLCGT